MIGNLAYYTYTVVYYIILFNSDIIWVDGAVTLEKYMHMKPFQVQKDLCVFYIITKRSLTISLEWVRFAGRTFWLETYKSKNIASFTD